MQAARDKQRLQVLIQTRQLVPARALGMDLSRSYPRDVDIWFLLASVHAAFGALDEVAHCCGKVVELQPQHVGAHFNRGVAQQTLLQWEAAEQSYRAALHLDPHLAAAKINLGSVLLSLGRIQEAVELYQQMLSSAAQPDVALRLQACINLSQALCLLERFEEAEHYARAALQIDPRCDKALNNLGQALLDQGRCAEAAAAHRQAVEAEPGFAAAHSNYLLDLNYLDDPQGVDVAAEHRRWGLQHADPLYRPKSHPNPRDPERRLRVGYVSPDLRAHPVALFFEPLLSAHDRARVEVYCYSHLARHDALTQYLQSRADHWRDVAHLNDDQLAALIAQDRIDILVDLAGHTGNNRLLAFARKPAPIQVTWLGYPNTTGMTMMDYRLTDTWADPPGEADERCTETLVRLPGGFLCYQPIQDSPDVAELPCDHAGHITFGCFNNSAKITPEVIALWSAILNDLPDARLLLKSRQLASPGLQERYREQFARHGVDPQRIDMLSRTKSTNDHLALYHRVDIALDPFPYNGTTTTCEALWMGVPVVALEGDRHAGRVGVSLLNSVGLAEFIASDAAAYKTIALKLARDPDELAALRAGLRARLQASPLLDRGRFAADVEDAYRMMWHHYCRQAAVS